MKPLVTNKKCLQISIAVALFMLCNSCLTPADKPQSKSTDTPTSEAVSQPVPTSESSYTTSAKSTNDEDDEDEDNQAKTITDGSYTATVDYSNPTTGYQATYTLSVEVSDGKVVQINFPNDGYLDDDHITPADIDEDGNASVEGEEGKTYDIHIDL